MLGSRHSSFQPLTAVYPVEYKKMCQNAMAHPFCAQTQDVLYRIRIDELFDAEVGKNRVEEVPGIQKFRTSAVSRFRASSPASGLTNFSMYIRMVAPDEPVPMAGESSREMQKL